MSKDLTISQGQAYDNHRDEIVEGFHGRCMAVAWVRRAGTPWATARAQFKPDPEFQGFATRVIECTNACAGIEDPAKFIRMAKELVKQLDRVDRGGKIPWVHNAALNPDIEKLRAICLAFVDVWNALGVPLSESIASR